MTTSFASSPSARASWFLIGVAALLAGRVSFVQAQENPVTPAQHAWGRFRAGSWKQVRVTTESFDETGKPIGTSVTETRTMLLAVDATGYELQYDSTVVAAGKRFGSEPKVARQGFYGEGPEQKVTVRRLGDRELKLGERKLAVHTAELEITDAKSKRILWLHYLPTHTPAVLSRRLITFDSAGQVQQETEVQTTSAQRSRTLLGLLHSNTWETKTVQKHATGRVVTEEIHSPSVPGGVVAHESQEFDDKGKQLRRSKLELVNYGVARTAAPLRRRHGRKSGRRNSTDERITKPFERSRARFEPAD